MNLNQNSFPYQDRMYLPVNSSVDTAEYLNKYITREFPDPQVNGNNAVYSIPSVFRKSGEKQASVAEQRVFARLQNLANTNDTKIKGLWMIFLHSTSYAGRSFRNHRIGKLIMREHDFVLFIKYQGKFFFVLIEVKCTCSNRTDKCNGIEKLSDAKEIKNNRRSAQHQIRDHLEILQALNNDLQLNLVQCYIMWPFLESNTKDPSQNTVKRWKEDKNLHVFEETIMTQEKFDEWFYENILQNQSIDEGIFQYFLNRYIILSSAVFVNEISQNMMALMTQEQLQLLEKENSRLSEKKVLVVHGAAGTGKTLLVLKKLEQLYHNGQLNEHNRALYICYWPGIRCEVELKLEALGIKQFVDTVRFFITRSDFIIHNKMVYKHIFMDEAEALCLSLDPRVIQNTLASIYHSYHNGNCPDPTCMHAILQPNESIVDKLEKHKTFDQKGELWFMVDINQACVFIPQQAPQIFKNPSLVLSKVMRSTGYIFDTFYKFYTETMSNITLGHHIKGPSVFWTDLDRSIDEKIARVVMDLCSTKGFNASDICVLPFIVNERLVPARVNQYIDEAFSENAFRPQANSDVEYYLKTKECNKFLLPWTLRVKGLEFKVVIIAIDGDDFDFNDTEDRKRFYIMISRCTSMLIVVSTKTLRKCLDPSEKFEDYTFNLDFA